MLTVFAKSQVKCKLDERDTGMPSHLRARESPSTSLLHRIMGARPHMTCTTMLSASLVPGHSRPVNPGHAETLHGHGFQRSI